MNYESSLTMEEKLGSLFQPDSVALAQYFETFRRRVPLQPERRLVLAVLEDAIKCIQKYGRARDSKGKRLFCEAEEWIMGEEPDWPLSFVNVCEMLDLDPGYLRRGLINMNRRQRFLATNASCLDYPSHYRMPRAYAR
jgi:hypothetical protein